MAIHSRLLIENACYHIYTRGNHKQKIFLDKMDYAACIARIKRLKKRHKYLLYGFCLMPNHLHLVGEPHTPQHLSKFMQCLLRSYTAYFNKRYNKLGHLWQGRFKSKAILKDGYLIDCIQYIELNPVRANIVKTPGEYEWSSFTERTLSQNTSEKIIDDLCL